MIFHGELQVDLDRNAKLVEGPSKTYVLEGQAIIDLLFDSVPASEMGPLVYREHAEVHGSRTEGNAVHVAAIIIRRPNVEFHLFRPPSHEGPFT
jgi:hypothetical protein